MNALVEQPKVVLDKILLNDIPGTKYEIDTSSHTSHTDLKNLSVRLVDFRLRHDKHRKDKAAKVASKRLGKFEQSERTCDEAFQSNNLNVALHTIDHEDIGDYSLLSLPDMKARLNSMRGVGKFDKFKNITSKTQRLLLSMKSLQNQMKREPNDEQPSEQDNRSLEPAGPDMECDIINVERCESEDDGDIPSIQNVYSRIGGKEKQYTMKEALVCEDGEEMDYDAPQDTVICSEENSVKLGEKRLLNEAPVLVEKVEGRQTKSAMLTLNNLDSSDEEQLGDDDGKKADGEPPHKKRRIYLNRLHPGRWKSRKEMVMEIGKFAYEASVAKAITKYSGISGFTVLGYQTKYKKYLANEKRKSKVHEQVDEIPAENEPTSESAEIPTTQKGTSTQSETSSIKTDADGVQKDSRGIQSSSSGTKVGRWKEVGKFADDTDVMRAKLRYGLSLITIKDYRTKYRQWLRSQSTGGEEEVISKNLTAEEHHVEDLVERKQVRNELCDPSHRFYIQLCGGLHEISDLNKFTSSMSDVYELQFAAGCYRPGIKMKETLEAVLMMIEGLKRQVICRIAIHLRELQKNVYLRKKLRHLESKLESQRERQTGNIAENQQAEDEWGKAVSSYHENNDTLFLSDFRNFEPSQETRSPTANPENDLKHDPKTFDMIQKDLQDVIFIVPRQLLFLRRPKWFHALCTEFPDASSIISNCNLLRGNIGMKCEFSIADLEILMSQRDVRNLTKTMAYSNLEDVLLAPPDPSRDQPAKPTDHKGFITNQVEDIKEKSLSNNTDQTSSNYVKQVIQRRRNLTEQYRRQYIKRLVKQLHDELYELHVHVKLDAKPALKELLLATREVVDTYDQVFESIVNSYAQEKAKRLDLRSQLDVLKKISESSHHGLGDGSIDHHDVQDKINKALAQFQPIELPSDLIPSYQVFGVLDREEMEEFFVQSTKMAVDTHHKFVANYDEGSPNRDGIQSTNLLSTVDQIVNIDNYLSPNEFSDEDEFDDEVRNDHNYCARDPTAKGYKDPGLRPVLMSSYQRLQSEPKRMQNRRPAKPRAHVKKLALKTSPEDLTSKIQQSISSLLKNESASKLETNSSNKVRQIVLLDKPLVPRKNFAIAEKGTLTTNTFKPTEAESSCNSLTVEVSQPVEEPTNVETRASTMKYSYISRKGELATLSAPLENDDKFDDQSTIIEKHNVTSESLPIISSSTSLNLPVLSLDHLNDEKQQDDRDKKKNSGETQSGFIDISHVKHDNIAVKTSARRKLIKPLPADAAPATQNTINATLVDNKISSKKGGHTEMSSLTVTPKVIQSTQASAIVNSSVSTTEKRPMSLLQSKSINVTPITIEARRRPANQTQIQPYTLSLSTPGSKGGKFQPALLMQMLNPGCIEVRGQQYKSIAPSTSTAHIVLLTGNKHPMINTLKTDNSKYSNQPINDDNLLERAASIIAEYPALKPSSSTGQAVSNAISSCSLLQGTLTRSLPNSSISSSSAPATKPPSLKVAVTSTAAVSSAPPVSLLSPETMNSIPSTSQSNQSSSRLFDETENSVPLVFTVKPSANQQTNAQHKQFSDVSKPRTLSLTKQGSAVTSSIVLAGTTYIDTTDAVSLPATERKNSQKLVVSGTTTKTSQRTLPPGTMNLDVKSLGSNLQLSAKVAYSSTTKEKAAISVMWTKICYYKMLLPSQDFDALNLAAVEIDKYAASLIFCVQQIAVGFKYGFYQIVAIPLGCCSQETVFLTLQQEPVKATINKLLETRDLNPGCTILALVLVRKLKPIPPNHLIHIVSEIQNIKTDPIKESSQPTKVTDMVKENPARSLGYSVALYRWEHLMNIDLRDVFQCGYEAYCLCPSCYDPKTIDAKNALEDIITEIELIEYDGSDDDADDTTDNSMDKFTLADVLGMKNSKYICYCPICYNPVQEILDDLVELVESLTLQFPSKIDQIPDSPSVIVSPDMWTILLQKYKTKRNKSRLHDFKTRTNSEKVSNEITEKSETITPVYPQYPSSLRTPSPPSPANSSSLSMDSFLLEEASFMSDISELDLLNEMGDIPSLSFAETFDEQISESELPQPSWQIETGDIPLDPHLSPPAVTVERNNEMLDDLDFVQNWGIEIPDEYVVDIANLPTDTSVDTDQSSSVPSSVESSPMKAAYVSRAERDRQSAEISSFPEVRLKKESWIDQAAKVFLEIDQHQSTESSQRNDDSMLQTKDSPMQHTIQYPRRRNKPKIMDEYLSWDYMDLSMDK